MATKLVQAASDALVGAPAYLYGVTWASTAAPGVRGVTEAEVVTVEYGKLAALVSPLASATIRARRRDLLRHADVLQDAFRLATVAPLSFGTVFENGAAVVDDFLTPRHDELVALLRRLDGTVELTVRAFYREEAVLAEVVREDAEVARLRGLGDHGSQIRLGEAVAEALAEKQRADAESVIAALVPLALDTVVEERQAELEVLRAAFLVARDAVGRFDAKMDELARARDGVVLFKYTGPLPPHHFASLEG